MDDYPLIPIDQLNAAELPSRSMALPFMESGAPGFLTVEQILSLIETGDIEEIVSQLLELLAEDSKASLKDADVFQIYDSDNGLSPKGATLSALLASIFKASRTIPNARFDGPTFGLLLATFRLTLAGALTAPRTVTFPDRDITVGLTKIAEGAIPSNVAVDFALPAGIRRATLLLNGFSTNGGSIPLVQLKSGGVAEATGYNGCASNSSSATAFANTAGVNLNSGHSADLLYQVKVELILQTGNVWSVFVSGSNSGPGTVTSSSSKSLAGVLDGIRLRSTNGSDIPDAGTFALFVEY